MGVATKQITLGGERLEEREQEVVVEREERRRGEASIRSDDFMGLSDAELW